MASLNIRGVRQKTPPTKTNDVDKDVVNIKDNLKIKLGDTKISISTIHIIIRECIEMLENLNIPGSEKRKHALIIIKTLMDDLSDNKEQHELMIKILDEHLIENTIDLVIDASRGKLNINTKKNKVLAHGCINLLLALLHKS